MISWRAQLETIHGSIVAIAGLPVKSQRGKEGLATRTRRRRYSRGDGGVPFRPTDTPRTLFQPVPRIGLFLRL